MRLHLRLAALSLSVILLWGCSPSPSNQNPAEYPSYSAEVLDPEFTGVKTLASGELIAWGSDGVIQTSADGKTWQLAELPQDKDGQWPVNNFKQLASNGKTLVVVGDNGALFRSFDQGKHWQRPAVETFSENLNDVIFDPRQKLWFAVADGGLILRSDDDGHHWLLMRTKQTENFLTIAQLQNAGTLIIGADNGVMGITEDDGINWQIVKLETETPITAFYPLPEVLIATSAKGKLFVSRDGAQSWEAIQAPSSMYFNDLIFDPEHRTIVVSAHTGNLLYSKDMGSTWETKDLSFGGTQYFIGDLFYDSLRKRLLAFGQHGMVIQSTDGGDNWAKLKTDLAESLKHVAYNTQQDMYVAVGERGFKAIMEAKNDHWQPVQTAYDYYWRESLVTKQGHFLIAGGLGKMLRSTDDGSSWSLIEINYPNPQTPPTYRGLVSLASGTLVAAGPTGLILRSTDDGQKWEIVYHTPFEKGEAFTQLYVDEKTQTVFAVEVFGGVFISRDEGKTWETMATNDERNMWFMDFADNRLCLVGAAGAAYTAEFGKDWTPISLSIKDDIFGCYFSQQHKALFLLGSKGMLWRQDLKTDQWSDIPIGLDGDLRRMIADPSSGNLVVFGGKGALAVSQDGGRNWSNIDLGIEAELRMAIIEPETGAILIAGQNGILLRSRDQGVSWEQIATHSDHSFRSIVSHPQTGSLLLVGERLVRLSR